MMEKCQGARREVVCVPKMLLTAVVLAIVILLTAVDDVAIAQAVTVQGVSGWSAGQVVHSTPASTSQGSSRPAVSIPQKPSLRSPYQPPAWTPEPAPWEPGGSWGPEPPWVFRGRVVNETGLSRLQAALSYLKRMSRR